ncbi:hypothetical protein AUK22_12025 [bacterium CG2_30_54_10]|nr:MAG: hypothetical protein AUK22_12025 [bacterium CG2_30_54_10]
MTENNGTARNLPKKPEGGQSFRLKSEFLMAFPKLFGRYIARFGSGSALTDSEPSLRVAQATKQSGSAGSGELLRFALNDKRPSVRMPHYLRLGGSFAFAFKLVLATVACLFAFTEASWALETTPDLLFQQMEERTEQIFSLSSDVELSSGSMKALVTLSIQSPDKFAMDFQNNMIRVVFDGERLWLYVSTLNEVFLLDTSSGGGWISDALRDWVNPREIVTRVTRKTLFSFFNVVMIDKKEIGSYAKELSIPLEKLELMRFTPVGNNVFKDVFEVGSYELAFSLESFLPVLVREFAPDGSLRGTLKVLKYRINETIPKERFVFVTPPGVVEVPFSTVIAQKLDQGKDFLAVQVQRLIEGLRRKLTDWGL